MIKYCYHWDQIESYVEHIYKEMRYVNLDCVVGIARGGLIPATMLAYRLNLKVKYLLWQLRDNDKDRDKEKLEELILTTKNGMLFVDDIVDSGATFRDIQFCSTIIRKNNKDLVSQDLQMYYSSLVKFKRSVPIYDLIYAHELGGDIEWAVFPWDCEQ